MAYFLPSYFFPYGILILLLDYIVKPFLWKEEGAAKDEFRFLMYHSAEEDVAVNAVIKDETVWLTPQGRGGAV